MWRELRRALERIFLLGQGELAPLLASCGLTFLVFTSFFILRPIRDAVQSEQNLKSELPWIITGTLIAITIASMIFSFIASRAPRRWILPVTLELFALSTLVFYVLFRATEHDTADAAVHKLASQAFYIWYSVANLLAISAAWSLLADTFTVEQSRRLFSKLSIGSTLGAISGSVISSELAISLGSTPLLLISIGVVQGAVAIAWWLAGRAAARPSTAPAGSEGSSSLGGGVFDGVRAVATQPYLLLIAAYVLLYTMTSTVLSIRQSSLLDTLFDPKVVENARDARTAFSGHITTAQNSVVLFTQLVATAHITRWLGVGRTLLVTPLITVGAFILLRFDDSADTLIIAMLARSSMHYAIDKPSREALYSPLPRDLKYKAKNLIDTVVYRGGDTVTAWSIAAIPAGLPLAIASVGLALTWCFASLPLGRLYNRRAAQTS